MESHHWDFTTTSIPSYIPAWLLERECSVRVNELARKAVLFIGIMSDRGEFVPYGTAFIGVWTDGDVGFTYMITAKHVLDDMHASKRPFAARMNTKSGGVEIGSLNGIDGWYYHPKDKKCDVAVALFNSGNKALDYRHVMLNDFKGEPGGVLTDQYIESHDIGCGDEVFTIGLLTRHFGQTKNIPVIRMGNISAMPEEPVDLGNKMGFQSVYLIESRSIGGLSGSPVFLQTPPVRVSNDSGIRFTDGHQSEYLMGINAGLFEISAHSDKFPSDDATRREHFLEQISAGIAVVIPIQRAIEIITDHPAMVVGRAEAMRMRDQKSGFKPTSAKPTISAAESSSPVQSASGENPTHREDFMSLLHKAAKTPPQED